MPPEDQKVTAIYELDDHVVSVTTKTLDILFSNPEYQDALVLYFFYIKAAKLQHSVNVWVGGIYAMKGLHWGNKRFLEAKKNLKELKLVEDVVDKDEKGIIRKYYIKVKFVWNPVMLETVKPSDAETQSLAIRTQVQDEYYYKNNNIKNTLQDVGGMENGGEEEKPKEAKKERIDFFLDAFNLKFGAHYRPTPGRQHKLALRLKHFTFEQIMEALDNLAASPWHRGENDRGWTADPDFLLRADEQIDKWLQKKQPMQEQQSFLPLSDLEIWQLAGELDVTVSVVRSKMEDILRMAESGEMKKYPYAKEMKETLVKWISSARDAGRIPRMNETERLDYPNKHPDVIARQKANSEWARKEGLV